MMGMTGPISMMMGVAANGDYIDTPNATPAIGAAFEGGFYTGMIWNELVQSTTVTKIATGIKGFIVPDMEATPIVYDGQTLEVRSRANPDNKMTGTVTSAKGTLLTLSIASVGGSGTFYDWSIMAQYRVIVAPKASGYNSGIAIKNANTALPTECQTLAEGWRATNAMKDAGTSTVYPAAHWARDLSIGGKSDWYVPARDELELCWRNLKPATDNNYTTRSGSAIYDYKNRGSFADASPATNGINLNSSPQGAAYTTTVPAQTSLAAFKTGGVEAFGYGSDRYWTSSDYNAFGAWTQNWVSNSPGYQDNGGETTAYRVRAVRRSII